MARIKAEFAGVVSGDGGQRRSRRRSGWSSERPMDKRSDRIIGVDKSPVPP